MRQPEYRHTLFDFLNMGDSAAAQYYKKGSKKSFKDDRIAVLDEAFLDLFPCGVKGDEVTFIGSVFFKYGEADSYLNHCIVLDTCDDVPNATIERCSTEAHVLQAWKRLILEQDPDVILGYNIFGFDYEFMFRRAIERGISYDFLTTLSKNRDESCYTQNRDGVVSIAEQKIVLASGEHNLSYIKMSGRVQVDLFNQIRREYNLPSYKLDYVAGHFIGDRVRGIELEQRNTTTTTTTTTIRSKNLTGLYDEAYVCFEVTEHSSEMHNNGEKFMVHDVRPLDGTFELRGVDLSELRGKDVRWCLAKDDVTPQDIFRLTGKGPSERAQVAKYCIQDCRLPMHIFNKIDAMTGFIEMSKLCSVPISFIVMRGQGIKLTSYMAKKCRDMGTLIPTISKSASNEAYEGAIVLEPKCDMYLDTPISCVDYGSLYPSSMISENISHDTKASTKEYNLEGDLIFYKGKDIDAMIVSKGIPYRDITYDTYRWVANPNGGKAKKQPVGRKTCRYVQPDAESGGRGVGIIPTILKELLAARKATRKQIPLQTDPFMKNVLDKRQLSIKVTANSIYGQCGAKTSTFYDMDVAASTTAIGRELLIFARDQIERKYADGVEVRTEKHGLVRTHAKCVYGDSITSYTPVYVRMNGVVNICAVEALADMYGDGKWLPMSNGEDDGKEYCEFDGLESWSDDGWTPTKRVIRHALSPDKNIIRVLTHTGMVDVTDDHSLLLRSGRETSPKNVYIGCELLHEFMVPNTNAAIETIHCDEAQIMGFFFGDGSCGVYNCPSGVKYSWALNNADTNIIAKYYKLCESVYPEFTWVVYDTLLSSGVYKIGFNTASKSEFVKKYASTMYYKKCKIIPVSILNASREIRLAFWNGVYDADGDKDNRGYKRICQKNQISSAHLTWLASSLGYKTSINTRVDKPNIYRTTATFNSQRKNPFAVKKMQTIATNSPHAFVYDLTTENNHFAAGVGNLIVHNTDSAFVSFGLTEADGKTPVVGRKALELSIALGEEAGEFVTRQLKAPHVLEYEKTFMPFCLLSKKRYVGMLYETDPDKCERKSMGIVLKRRDNAPIVKDVYGGIIDILMKTQDVNEATRFLNAKIHDIIAGRCPMQKLVITKSLRSNYANPKQIAHKVLADRIAERDPGNAPRPGDRVAYVHVHVPTRSKAAEKALLTGDKIELPKVVLERGLQLDYGYYLTNQIMKPVQQLFALVLEQLPGFHHHERDHRATVDKIYDTCFDRETFEQKRADARAKLVKKLMFDPHLTRANNAKSGQTEIGTCFLPLAAKTAAPAPAKTAAPAPAPAKTKTQPKITAFFKK